MENHYVLSIDRGQSKIKAAICSENGNVLYISSSECQPLQVRHEGWAEQDMNEIWEKTVSAIRSLFSQCPVDPKEIEAISFSGQGGGNFLVASDGKPLYPGVVSMDTRHEEVVKMIKNSGNLEIPRTVAFMLWLKMKEPEVYQKTRWVLGSKDWIRFCLTGKANADFSDLPAPADFETRQYQKEKFEAAGIPECVEKMPPIVWACEEIGTVTKKAAEETGLVEGTKVIAGAHDMIACAIGAGGIKEGHLTIIMGTMGINIAVVDKNTKLTEPSCKGMSFTFAGAVKGQRMATSSIGSGCNTMNQFLDLLFQPELEEAKKEGKNKFDYLEELLEGHVSSSIIFQPYLLGTFYNSKAKAGFIGISAQTSRKDLLFSMFQGVCSAMCMEIQNLESRGLNFTDIWIVGGGSKSRLWGQMFADFLGKTVKISKTGENGCRGAAICAGIALGKYSMQDGFPFPEIEKQYEPREEMHKTYQNQMRLYRQAYDAMCTVWNNT